MHYIVSGFFTVLYFIVAAHLLWNHIGQSIFVPISDFPSWLIVTGGTLTILMTIFYFVGSLLLLFKRKFSVYLLTSGLLAQTALLFLRSFSEHGYIILDLLSILSPLFSLGVDWIGYTGLLPGMAVCLYGWLLYKRSGLR